MFTVAALALLVTMFMVLFRAFKGPRAFERIQAVNSFGTLTVLLIAVHGFLLDRPEFLDIALAYALINFTSVLAMCKYVKFSSLGRGQRDSVYEQDGDI